MKIDEKIVSIPPYISTTWQQINSIKFEQGKLIIALIDGTHIDIPDLELSIIEKLFDFHLKHLENSTSARATPPPPQANPFAAGAMGMENGNMIGLPLAFGPEGFEGLGAAMQHNPNQANTPPLPEDLLNKVAAVAKVFSEGDTLSLPKPEPHCNCLHCQVARAIQDSFDEESQQEEAKEEMLIEESISDEDLRFREWDIAQENDKLFIVSNPFDSDEQYNVFLGSPVGCTCGKQGCEHIKAVLQS